MLNLEPLCAECGFEMAAHSLPKSDRANVIQQSLGILIENGVYAYTLFLNSRKNEQADYARHLLKKSFALFQKIGLIKKEPTARNEQFTTARDIAANLSTLLVARNVLEQALVFARYHCKAEPPAGGKT